MSESLFSGFQAANRCVYMSMIFISYHYQFTNSGGLNMTEALTVGDEESRSTARKVMIPTTP